MKGRISREVLGTSLALTAWLLAVGFGLYTLTRYSLTPGAQASAGPNWPEATKLTRAADRATLLMFAHPRCPCSRSSVHELAKLLTRLPGKVAVQVVFIKPAGTDQDFGQTDLARSAAAIPTVKVVTDEGGVESKRFGARTSGQVLLFDSAGHRLFSGGMTDGRGHEGDNIGLARIESILTRGTADKVTANVYGCALEEGGNRT